MGNLRTISKDELYSILEKHKMWLNNEPGGKRANLSGANLTEAYLNDVDLREANLRGANLSDAHLRGANLIKANLRWINLTRADLREADLRGANLRGANLSEAYLSWADLRDADLRGANLRGANFCWTNLSGAKLDWPLVCPEKGSFVGYKKCQDNLIVELEIQEDALRSSSTTRKCRCSKAKVLSITDLDGSEVNVEYAVSKMDSGFLYKVGEVSSVNDFDTNRWNECSAGIHFFMTRKEAVEYTY